MMDRGEYPDNWNQIAFEIKEKADWCCENCNQKHDPENGYCLTVHHLDRDKCNCEYSNLVALCQRCHLIIQAKYLPGQLFMFDTPAWVIKRGLV